MFAVNRFVVAPNGTVSVSAQSHSTRGSGVACELADRPVGCCWLAAAFAFLDTRNSWLTDSGPVVALPKM